MKFCNKCNKLYEDSLFYCPECGSKLDSTMNYDIFGDPLNAEQDGKNQDVVQDGVVYDENKEIIDNKQEKISYRKIFREKNAEIFALVTIATMFLPIYGIFISVYAVIANASILSQEKKNLGYLILSIFTLIFSVVWLILVIKNGIIQEYMIET